MRVAGIGFRPLAPIAALAEVLARAERAAGAPAEALATPAGKAGAVQVRALAASLDLPLIAVPEAALAGIDTPTRSARVEARYGTGSVAEAAALVAAGPGARIVAARLSSTDRTATAAIAIGDPS